MTFTISIGNCKKCPKRIVGTSSSSSVFCTYICWKYTDNLTTYLKESMSPEVRVSQYPTNRNARYRYNITLFYIESKIEILLHLAEFNLMHPETYGIKTYIKRLQ